MQTSILTWIAYRRMMAPMRRSWLLLLPLLFLSGCGPTTSGTASCDREYYDDVEKITVCVPSGWSVIDRETLRQRGVPDDTLVALQADEAVSGHFPTVTVTRELLSQPATPEAYSDASIRSVSVLPGYTLIESPAMQLDGTNVRLHVFTAQPVADEPIRRFYQVSTVVKEKGYSVTATTPVSVADALEKQVTFILENVRFGAQEVPASAE